MSEVIQIKLKKPRKKFRRNQIVCFNKDIKSYVGRHLILKAHIPVRITHITKGGEIMFITLPNGKPHSLRYIEKRMYKAGPMGKVLFG